MYREKDGADGRRRIFQSDFVFLVHDAIAIVAVVIFRVSYILLSGMCVFFLISLLSKFSSMLNVSFSDDPGVNRICPVQRSRSTSVRACVCLFV